MRVEVTPKQYLLDGLFAAGSVSSSGIKQRSHSTVAVRAHVVQTCIRFAVRHHNGHKEPSDPLPNVIHANKICNTATKATKLHPLKLGSALPTAKPSQAFLLKEKQSFP